MLRDHAREQIRAGARRGRRDDAQRLGRIRLLGAGPGAQEHGRDEDQDVAHETSCGRKDRSVISLAESRALERAEAQLQIDRQLESRHVGPAIVMKVGPLALDRARRGRMRNAEAAGDERGPFVRMLVAPVVAAARSAQHRADQLRFGRARALAGDDHRPLHRRAELRVGQRLPDPERAAILADRHVRLREHRRVELVRLEQLHHPGIALVETDQLHVAVGIEAVRPEHQPPEPVAATSPRERTDAFAAQRRPAIDLRAGDEILQRAATDAARHDPEARALRERGERGRRAQLADRQRAGIVGGGDLGAAEDDFQREVEPFVAEKPALDPERERQRLLVGRDAVFHFHDLRSAAMSAA